MQRVYEIAVSAARTTLPVLVLGETGSGKELVVRGVHEASKRSQAPFKALNCAALPQNLLESALFGHERGAFTGADRQAPGLFEQAHGGTVFLDEVGELSLPAQAALLRVLEQRRVVRVGGTREIPVDTRVVAATHRDLEAMVRAGSFREDLTFRLKVVSIRVPPLRERPEEILPLAEHFLSLARAQWNPRVVGVTNAARQSLSRYLWPGNVRELKNAIDSATALCSGELLDRADLPDPIQGARASAPGLQDVREPAGFRSLPDRVREFETGLIHHALQAAHGNQAQAARLLGVPRRTLATKVHAYGLLETSPAEGLLSVGA